MKNENDNIPKVPVNASTPEVKTKASTPKIINFNQAYVAPVNKINPKKGLVEWGSDNNYPSYLLELFNFKGSTTHKSIINKKVKLSTGQGFEDVVNEELKEFMKINKFDKLARKLDFDYEIFNGFCFEVIYDRLGENPVKINHVPFNRVRFGIETEDLEEAHFWVSDDWKQSRKELYKPKYIKAFDNSKEGRQLYYYSEYNPGSDGYYPTAGYSTSMNWIEMDFEISQFHLNQAKNGYAPSFILNVATGAPSEEAQDSFAKGFERNFAGTENAGKVLITYSEGKETEPSITPFLLNDSDKRFIMLIEQIEKNIVLGAEIPPQLVLLQPGKLGSSDERTELLDEFQKSYISPRQNVLEECLNRVLTFGEDVVLKSYIDEGNDDTIATGDTNQDSSEDTPDNANLKAQANLRGSVGGVQSLTTIIQNVSDGLMSRESAIATLELIFGFNNEDANRLLGDVQEGDSEDTPNENNDNNNE